MKHSSFLLSSSLLLTCLLGACATSMPNSPTATQPVVLTFSPTTIGASPTPIGASPTTIGASPTPTAQPRLHPSILGPDLENLPAGVNPLTGLEQQDHSMLQLPAVLVSISNMPPTARPQAGLAFADWVYELFIGEGTSRFLAAFYGDLPRRIPNDQGGCTAKPAAIQAGQPFIGNRVWLDENKDGIQQPWEAGVGSVCLSLLNPSGKTLLQTATDSNGYYGFSTDSLTVGEQYTLKVTLPPAYTFTTPNVGNDDQDSDIDPESSQFSFTYSGNTDQSTNESLDAGLQLIHPAPPANSPADIAPDRTYVGPIRSGRLTYNDFVNTYPASCLVFASAGRDILPQLKTCEVIYGEDPLSSPNTALLDTFHLKQLAQKNSLPNTPVNYSGHLFDPATPAGGLPAQSLWTYFHAYTQAFWQFDPLSHNYLRHTDDADGLGVFHPHTDRLTNRQLSFENVVIILAEYSVFRHGQYDVELCCGMEGYAYLFRDGMLYKIRWSTNNRGWEQKTGLQRPLYFTTADRKPFPLKPGRTFVSIMTKNSAVRELSPGYWQAFFAMPDDYATPDP